MVLSSDRQNHLIHLVCNELQERNFISYLDKEKALLPIRQSMDGCIKVNLEMDQKVREKLNSLKRKIIEVSSEWEVLYDNYMEQEMIRRGLLKIKDRPSR